MIHHILYIDDSPDDHRIVKLVVSRVSKGTCKTSFALTVDEALHQLETSNFDVVLVDHKLHPTIGIYDTLPQLEGRLGRAKLYVVSDFLEGIDKDGLPAFVTGTSTKEKLPTLIWDVLQS